MIDPTTRFASVVASIGITAFIWLATLSQSAATSAGPLGGVTLA